MAKSSVSTIDNGIGWFVTSGSQQADKREARLYVSWNSSKTSLE